MVSQWCARPGRTRRGARACLTYVGHDPGRPGRLDRPAVRADVASAGHVRLGRASSCWSSWPARASPRSARGGTPWHAHHIAERYGLLVIIALGEGLLGTTVAARRARRARGAGLDDRRRRCSALAGMALTFGLWWIYFVIPCGDLLARAPRAVLRLGLRPHPAVRRASSRSAPACTPRPTTSRTTRDLGAPAPCSPWRSRSASTCLGLYALYAALTAHVDPFHLLLIALTARRRRGLRGARPSAARSLAWCLLVLALAPVGDRGRLRDASATGTASGCSPTCDRLLRSAACAHGGCTSSATPRR